MRGSPLWRGARPREADERRPVRGGSECAAAIGQLLVLISAIALTTLPFTGSERAPALLLFLIGWSVMASARDTLSVRSPNGIDASKRTENEDRE